jgi:hypothetical protein
VTLVIVDAGATPLGVLPPVEVDGPWWPQTTDIVATAKDRFGVDVTVLRLLRTEPGRISGGAVSYLAEAASIPDRYAGPVDEDLSPHPLRAAYAHPGGPAASLRWASDALDGLGRGPVRAAVQHKTWNLSAIWELDTPYGSVWLKHVPAFFAHEAAVLQWIGAGPGARLVPGMLAARDGRMLLDHVPGEDLFGAGVDVRDAIAADYHGPQLASVGALDTLAGLGVPDLRGDNLIAALTGVVARHGQDARLDALVDGLADRLATVDKCGLPDTLVHGDLHPGNVRSDGQRRAIIDWGDSFLGHPAFDIIRLGERLPEPDRRVLLDAWAGRWRTAVPGCDPDTAVELLHPVAALRNAFVYASFLDHIEPAEHPYHRADVPLWLGEAITAAQRSARPRT